MSKHLGNILEPIPLMDRHGADAVRWFMLAGGSPWSARRVGHETLSEVVRKVLLTYWNTASFFTLYAEANGWDPAADARPRPRAERPLLDRWALAELAAGHRRRDDGAGGLRHPDGRPADRRVRRRPVQLVRPPVAAPLLGRRPGGAGHAARGARRADPADGAVHAVRHRGGVGARGRAGPGRTRPTRCTSPRWPTVDEDARDDALVGADGPGPAAGRAGPVGADRRPRCAPASRWPGRWSPPRAGRRSPATWSPRSPTS